MKRTVKTIIALALALTMICALGTAAFADANTVVTKNPTDETRYVGETAIFIANAANYDSIECSSSPRTAPSTSLMRSRPSSPAAP